MKTLIAALAVVFVLGSTAYGGWYGYGYVGPRAAYYAAPVYAYPPTQVVVPATPYMTYSPVVPARVLAPAPVVVGRPVVVGPAGRVYIPGRPVRNAVRAVVW